MRTLSCLAAAVLLTGAAGPAGAACIDEIDDMALELEQARADDAPQQELELERSDGGTASVDADNMSSPPESWFTDPATKAEAGRLVETARAAHAAGDEAACNAALADARRLAEAR